METLGKRVGVDALVADLLKDRAYHEASGGGVTPSGGEPLARPGFSTAVLRALRERGISTVVDTRGFASTEALDALAADARASGVATGLAAVTGAAREERTP
jgi:pyruvate formate lyase activating enzyme